MRSFLGRFGKLGNITKSIVNDGGGGVKPYNEQYLTFEALEAGTFTLTIPSALSVSNLSSISYSLDGGSNWITTNNVANTEVVITTPSVAVGNKVLWKGSGIKIGHNSSSYCIFTSTGKFNVCGNIMSLIDGDNFKNDVTLDNSTQTRFANRLFYQNENIVNAENLILPATTLASYCYNEMFMECVSLVKAPKTLPATTLNQYCYSAMFQGCTSLEKSPDILAEIFTTRCCSAMFKECSSLNYIKCLATDISASYCVSAWVSGVAAEGTFVKNANMNSWNTGQGGIPDGWTVIDA